MKPQKNVKICKDEVTENWILAACQFFLYEIPKCLLTVIGSQHYASHDHTDYKNYDIKNRVLDNEGSTVWALCIDHNASLCAETGVKSSLRMGHFDKNYEKRGSK